LGTDAERIWRARVSEEEEEMLRRCSMRLRERRRLPDGRRADVGGVAGAENVGARGDVGRIGEGATSEGAESEGLVSRGGSSPVDREAYDG